VHQLKWLVQEFLDNNSRGNTLIFPECIETYAFLFLDICTTAPTKIHLGKIIEQGSQMDKWKLDGKIKEIPVLTDEDVHLESLYRASNTGTKGETKSQKPYPMLRWEYAINSLARSYHYVYTTTYQKFLRHVMHLAFAGFLQ
jgi:hypothetical protein